MIREVYLAAAILYAQPVQHQHPPEHAQLHEKFYSNWRMPDNRALSCCDSKDCSPAASKVINGVWYAKRPFDVSWRKIPPHKIEKDRDSPDGQSHLCAPLNQDSDTVWCFIAGEGT